MFDESCLNNPTRCRQNDKLLRCRDITSTEVSPDVKPAYLRHVASDEEDRVNLMARL
jgi:hypothetical protein